MEVEVREAERYDFPSPNTTILLVNDSFNSGDGAVVVVRIEEVLLVVIVLMIWVAAIALFFNRWGKIRMLEPYQPKFHQQSHRPSCPLAPLSPPNIPPQPSTLPRTQKVSNQRMSFSKYNVNALTDPLSVLPSPIIRKPRRSSVFVGSCTMTVLDPPPRRVKSAIDIHHLIANEPVSTSLSGNRKGSIIPILNRDRRASVNVERLSCSTCYKSASSTERPLISIQHRNRRSSCFVERTASRHRNFTSVEKTTPSDRNLSISIERPSCSYQPQPIINFETLSDSTDQPLVFVESSYIRETVPILTFPKVSRSFEQPPRERLKPERMASSLEIASVSFDRRSSIPEEDRASPVSVYIEDTKITAPLLDALKSSDV